MIGNGVQEVPILEVIRHLAEAARVIVERAKSVLRGIASFLATLTAPTRYDRPLYLVHGVACRCCCTCGKIITAWMGRLRLNIASEVVYWEDRQIKIRAGNEFRIFYAIVGAEHHSLSFDALHSLIEPTPDKAFPTKAHPSLRNHVSQINRSLRTADAGIRLETGEHEGYKLVLHVES